MENKSKNHREPGKPEEVVIPIQNNQGFVSIKTARVRRGDKVIWKAIDSDVILFFPDPNLFGETLGTVRKGRNKELIVQIKPRRTEEEIFHYSVYHHGLEDFGQGNSSPAIIIQK